MHTELIQQMSAYMINFSEGLAVQRFAICTHYQKFVFLVPGNEECIFKIKNARRRDSLLPVGEVQPSTNCKITGPCALNSV